MALIQCKECKSEVSDQAKTCPNCGAKVPQKTSIVTWLAFIIIVFFVFSKLYSEPNLATTNTPSKSTTKREESKSDTTRVNSDWYVSSSSDEMTGKKSFYAISQAVKPTRAMSFPYNNVEAWIGVGCDIEREWAFIGFNSSPNLADDETMDGYSLINTRIKWDEQIENLSLTQKWGAKFLHFRMPELAIEKMASSKRALLELTWHGEQGTYFNFSLKGSSTALEKIRSSCR